MHRKRPALLVAFCLALLLFVTALVALPRLRSRDVQEGLVVAKESSYQSLYVTREDDILMLRAGSLTARSSALDLRNPYRHVLEYTALMMLGLGYVTEPDQILILGLGGGTLTRYLRRHYPEAQITSVEIDPEVLTLARTHFGLPVDPRTTVVVEDARRFLLRTPGTYDLIFFDAYHGDYIPFHLLTREFLELVRDHLRVPGAVVANTWSDQGLYERESATYAAVFGTFHSYLGDRTSNRVIVATRDPREISYPELQQRVSATQQRRAFAELDLPALLEKHFDRDLRWPADTPVLTDDHAPVNFLVGRGHR